MLSHDDLTPHYEHTRGQHNFEAVDGTPVHAIAASNWADCEHTLRDEPPMSGYVIAPELITVDVGAPATNETVRTAQKRINTALELSVHHPQATLLIGSPTIDNTGIMRNSLVVIRDGKIEGNLDKLGSMSTAEEAIFSKAPRPQAVLPAGQAALVCSDLITAYSATTWVSSAQGHGRALADAHTVLLASSWETSQGGDASANGVPEEYYRRTLERAIDSLFRAYPHIREVIIADRGSEALGISPYAAQYRRP